MENLNVIEGNKLIAEFMGGKYDKDTTFKIQSDEIWLPIHGIVNCATIESGKGRIIQYHTSWDWLMPVVEKIENFNDGCTLCIIEDERCHINTQTNFEVDSVGYTKIEAVYNAIIEFIKWYNQQETKNNC